MQMDTQKFLKSLRQELPPTFTRVVASRMTGGYIAVGTLANLDSKNLGPGGILVGKKILYERETFLSWLEQRITSDGASVRRNLFVRPDAHDS